eukprot:SAG22_NODE_1906_length_3335_cov_1.833127_4_plen_81_part_00
MSPACHRFCGKEAIPFDFHIQSRDLVQQEAVEGRQRDDELRRLYCERIVFGEAKAAAVAAALESGAMVRATGLASVVRTL